MRVQPVLAAGRINLQGRPHIVGPRERRVGAPLFEHLGAQLEERGFFPVALAPARVMSL